MEVVSSNPTAKPLYFYTYFHSLQHFCPKFILKYVLNSLRSTLQGYSRNRSYTVHYVYVNLEKRPKNTQKLTYGTISNIFRSDVKRILQTYNMMQKCKNQHENILIYPHFMPKIAYLWAVST